jgi:hypothetical protein
MGTMKAIVTMEIDIPEGSCDSHCDAEHLICSTIENVVLTQPNVDGIFEALKVKIEYK